MFDLKKKLGIKVREGETGGGGGGEIERKREGRRGEKRGIREGEGRSNVLSLCY